MIVGDIVSNMMYIKHKIYFLMWDITEERQSLSLINIKQILNSHSRYLKSAVADTSLCEVSSC